MGAQLPYTKPVEGLEGSWRVEHLVRKDLYLVLFLLLVQKSVRYVLIPFITFRLLGLIFNVKSPRGPEESKASSNIWPHYSRPWGPSPPDGADLLPGRPRQVEPGRNTKGPHCASFACAPSSPSEHNNICLCNRDR